MPTAFSVGPLAQKRRIGDEDGVVWALSGKAATARGRVIAPLYRNVPTAAADDLALADTLGVGRSREREMAHLELSSSTSAV